MNFTHYDLGGLAKGRTVEVTLQGNSANVYLLDHPNMVKYVKGQPFAAMGGLMKSSPIRLQTTAVGHWHVVIDLPNGYGTVKTGHRLLAGSVPPTVSTKAVMFKATEAQMRAVAAENAANVSAGRPAPRPEKPLTSATPAPLPQSADDQISCNACGILTRPGKFCTDCGAPMSAERICPTCSTANTFDCKFCSECGLKLAG
ncbi:MAG: DUF1883 domain-containing protein [Defluviitaleaceae bacterium]|nr:DUF1883 domain-containing protein [Defluviitaleaceae bacterium]MCL2261882.1 DUF1883 domain-containing protein [Defluviitaleaceae bacterium]